MKGSKKRAERSSRGVSARSILRAGQIPIGLLLLVAPLALLPMLPQRGEENARLVSPDRIDDVPLIQADADAFPLLDNFAWRAFISLNWPALNGPTQRGVADRSKELGDPGPRVWETFKARYELFQVGRDGRPIAPPPWATYDAANPCGSRIDGRVKTLASFDPFMDFNQPVFTLGATGNPLVAQNRTYTRYETRLNETEYLALARSGWSQGKNLPDQANPARLPAGSIAVKAAWRLLTAADTPAVRARYYIVNNANVVDIAKTIAAGRVVCSKRDVAMVGLHIVIRTKRRPQGIWSSFEHVDNVRPVGKGEAREPDATDAGAAYSYFDASKASLGLWPKYGSAETLSVSIDNPPKVAPEPMQVVRRYPIHPSTMTMNRTYWALPGIKGTVWEHYMLVANQWPTMSYPMGPHNDGLFFPDSRKENLANTTMETYFQDPPSNCMSCHHRVSNALGRDFVGILDSFR